MFVTTWLEFCITRIQEPIKKYDRKERKTKFIYFKNKKSSSVLCHFIIDMNQFYGYEYTIHEFSEILCKTFSFWTNFTKHRFWSHRNCSIGSTLALKAKHTYVNHAKTHIHTLTLKGESPSLGFGMPKNEPKKSIVYILTNYMIFFLLLLIVYIHSHYVWLLF